jgi:cation diffusion facilitator family transporter
LSDARSGGGRVLGVAAAVSAFLAVVKFAVGLLTSSMTVMASAADSFADALMSAVNWWGYRVARVPADEDHPYGHGKLEGAVAVGQGMLLLGITVSLVASAVMSLVQGAVVAKVDAAVAVLAASGGVSLLLAVSLQRTSERSVVISADTAHYRVDVLSAVAGVGGLLLMKATGHAWVDPVLCIILSLAMGRESYGVLRLGAAEILDEALPEEDQAKVRAVLEQNAERVVEFHGLRTRRSGPLHFVEVHAVFPPERALGDVHEVVEDIGDQIRTALPGSRVLVHPDAAGHRDRVDHSLEGEPT